MTVADIAVPMLNAFWDIVFVKRVSTEMERHAKVNCCFKVNSHYKQFIMNSQIEYQKDKKKTYFNWKFLFHENVAYIFRLENIGIVSRVINKVYRLLKKCLRFQ